MSVPTSNNGHNGAFDLSGQTAIVAGGAMGIGEAIARRLASAGATLALVDLNPAAAKRTAEAIGCGAFAVEANVADPEATTRAAAEILSRTGGIHILVNNVGIAGTAVVYMTDRIPMERTGKPDEIAPVVHFLAIPDCSFVTAQCHDVSGGRATY